MAAIYATIAEVKAFKVNGAVTGIENSYSDAELTAEIEFIEALINSYTGTSFYSVPATAYYFDGAGNRSLFFYPKLGIPNVSVTEVLEVDEFDNTLFTFVSTDYSVEKWAIHKTWRDRSEGRRAFSRSGTTWPTGIRNLKITGNWGYATVPALVNRATILLVLESLLPNSTNMQATGLEEQRWDDYKVRYAQNGTMDLFDSTGYPKVDLMLQEYLCRPDMFLTPQVHAPQ